MSLVWCFSQAAYFKKDDDDSQVVNPDKTSGEGGAVMGKDNGPSVQNSSAAPADSSKSKIDEDQT